MKIEEALNYADEWTNGHTFYEGMQGWRVVCAVLAAEVRRQRENLTQLLTGLECRNIELAVNENTPDAFKLVGELIAHRAKQNTGYPPSLDDNTRKMVLELCESLSSGEILSLDDANTFLRSMYVKAKNIREKLGAGDEN